MNNDHLIKVYHSMTTVMQKFCTEGTTIAPPDWQQYAAIVQAFPQTRVQGKILEIEDSARFPGVVLQVVWGKAPQLDRIVDVIMLQPKWADGKVYPDRLVKAQASCQPAHLTVDLIGQELQGLQPLRIVH